MVFKYDDEEWANLVPPDPGWTREETDYLLDTCAVYQLRFLVIADRYDVSVSRTVLV
jgi:DNA methyltransferase 1-associated protein 1